MLCLFSDVTESDVFPSRQHELSAVREATADPLHRNQSELGTKKKTKKNPNKSGLNFCPCTKTKKSELLPYFSRNITSHYRLAAGHYHTEPSQ